MLAKKAGFLLLAALLLLTGCSGEASLVRDAVVKSVETPNYEYQGTLKLTGNLDELLKLSGEEVDDNVKALLAALEAGLTFTGSQYDIDQAKMTFSANDDKILRDNGLWTGDQPATLELLMDVEKTYVGTPIDDKYILIDPASTDDSGVDPEKARAFQEKVMSLTLDFMKKYVSKYGYKLSDVENLGEETVTLPNGEKVKATHIAISLDAKELINLLLYTAKDATTNKDVRDFAVDFMMLMATFAAEQQEALGPEAEPFPAPDRAEIEQTVDQGLAELKEAIADLEETYTVDEIVELAKQNGLESITLNLDYYIDKDKLPVRSTSNIKLTVKDPEGELKVPVTVALEADSYAWNFGKTKAITFPGEDQVVTIEQLMSDKDAINAFNQEGFLYHFLKEMTKETGTIIFDLNEKSATLNGEEVDNISPYLDAKTGTTMVPFRFIGEAMGAEISFDDKTKTGIFAKDGKRIELVNGSAKAKVDGKEVSLPLPATIKNGSFYVPLRFVSEQMGAEVIWLDELKQAIIEYEIAG